MDRVDVLNHLSRDSLVSGERLADIHGVTRNAVWKHIDSLRDEGFVIDSNGKGYRLVDVPDLSEHGVKYFLDTKWIGCDVEFHEEIDSTNTRAVDLARGGVDEGFVVLADRQVMGRGRRGRRWESPRGGLWMSVVLRPDAPPSSASIINHGAAVAVTRALRDMGIDADIKWPNDVLVDERKICGILVEFQSDAEMINHVVTGFGLNVNNDVSGDLNAVSVRGILGEEVVRSRLAADILYELEEVYGLDSMEVLDEWRDLSSTLGSEVEVEMVDEVVRGVAVDINSDGSLRLDSVDDGEIDVSVGDCRHLR